MIGLVDYAVQASTSTTLLVPNIEIMKLATYYKVEENQFCRLIDLDETDLTPYDKIYFFCEDNIVPNVPSAFKRANNVIFGGTAFTNGIYKPFENEIIDFTLPRPAIYKEFLKQKHNDGIKPKVISHILDDTYYRNFAGEKRLPMPAVLPRKRVILYDKDFFYPDWQKTLQVYADRKCSTIMRLHPIVCNTVGQFFEARNFNKLNRANEFILDFNIPLDQVNILMAKYKMKFLADITTTSNVYLWLGGTKSTKLQYAHDLRYKLNLLYEFWSKKIPILLKYQEPTIGTINYFADLEKFIVAWCCGKTKDQKSINERIPKNKKYDYLRDLRDDMIKLLPSTKDLFNQSYLKLNDMGRWIL